MPTVALASVAMAAASTSGAATFCRAHGTAPSNPWVRPPSGCVVVPSVCFEAEQIILHGPAASAALPALIGLLNRTRDPSDVFSKLRPLVRPTVLVDPPVGEPYQYLPLATGAKRVPSRLRSRFMRTHRPLAATSLSTETAIAFFTSWSNSFTEIFSRAVVRLYELWCALLKGGEGREQMRLLPAMWGSSWGPDYNAYWLRPFSSLQVHTMAATPPRELVKLIWRAQATAEQFERYANESAAMFRSRHGPRCYQRAFVCDFTGMPWGHTLHPWSAVQMIAAHHGGATQAVHTQRVSVPRMRACSLRNGNGMQAREVPTVSTGTLKGVGAASGATGVGADQGRRLGGTRGHRAISQKEASAEPVEHAVKRTIEERAMTHLRRQVARDIAVANVHASADDDADTHRKAARQIGSAEIVADASRGQSAARHRSGRCALNIVFADRKGRRKISNILSLVSETQWCATV